MPEPVIPDDAPSLAGDRYAVVSRIGEGGMASVYRAYDRKLAVWRAVKILNPQHSRRVRLRTRFESEARTMARLEHNHLVRIYDVGVEGKLPFMVMELVTGGSLQEWMDRNGPMPTTLALHAIKQVLAGLECVHQAGIVHRDVKPHNVLVANPGICKLTDFGIAQIQDDARTKTGSVLGTQGYMSPEQRLDAKTVDHRADLYGVGATLWSLLTGMVAQDLYNFSKQPKLARSIDPAVVPILAKSLAYSREDRYQNARAMSIDVEAALVVLGSTGREVGDLPDDDITKSNPIDREAMDELGQVLAEGRTSADEPDDSEQKSLPPTRVLPYYMPKVEGEARRSFSQRVQEDEALPDWIDRSSLQRTDDTEEDVQIVPPPEAVIAPGSEEGAPPAPVEPEGEEDEEASRSASLEDATTEAPERPSYLDEPDPPPAPTPKPAPPPLPEDPPESLAARLLTLALIPIALGVALLAVVGAVSVVVVKVSGSQVDAVELRATDARDQLYEAMRREQDVIRLLGDVGADRVQLEELYLVWTETKREPEHVKAAVAFLDRCESEGHRWVEEQGGTPAQVQANHSLRRLRAARGEYEAAVTEWQGATEGPMGWIATTLAGSNSPP